MYSTLKATLNDACQQQKEEASGTFAVVIGVD